MNKKEKKQKHNQRNKMKNLNLGLQHNTLLKIILRLRLSTDISN